MKRLIEYIITERKGDSKRKEELINYLKGKKYPDYLDTLEDMLNDPKTRALIEDGFGGNLGNTQLKFSEKVIPVRRLLPTQEQIGMAESLRYGLEYPHKVKLYFSGKPIEIKHPIITFNSMYVIDGHHRWSEVLCFNPDAEVVCLNYDGDMSPLQMLKATQGAIAASIGEIIKSRPKGANLYDCDKFDIEEYIDDKLTDECVEEYIKQVEEIETREDVIQFIIDNVMELIHDYPPIKYAPAREEMPQTSKAGGVDDEESALGRMKNDKVLKVK